MICTDCGKKAAGLRCRACSTAARRRATAHEYLLIDLDLLTLRADHRSFAYIGRRYGCSRQRVNERLWISARRLGVELSDLHPDTIRAALDAWMMEQAGASIYRLPKSAGGGLLNESGEHPAQ